MPEMDDRRVYLFDSTLRDGAQTQGVDFSVADKQAIAEALDRFGIDYVEGGWPGANPTDDAFFASPPAFERARPTAFGMTRRPGHRAGARWIVLCDTNGGTLPHEVERIVGEVTEHIPGSQLGIHAHNDTENAVANSLAALRAGARQVQGTLNGLGERCGNANLVSLIPSLMLKTDFELGLSAHDLSQLTHLSRLLDERLNRLPHRSAAYVGESAFAHKGGLHVSAVEKDPRTYEHVDPALVGNRRHIVVSDQSGR